MLVSQGVIRLTERCRCGKRVPPALKKWLLTYWLHGTKCCLCNQHLRVDIRFVHDEQNGRKCWNLQKEIRDGGEIEMNSDVWMVHSRCWRDILGKDAIRKARNEGIRLASSVVADYDRTNSHPYMVSDCILGKLNLLPKEALRKNKDPLVVRVHSEEFVMKVMAYVEKTWPLVVAQVEAGNGPKVSTSEVKKLRASLMKKLGFQVAYGIADRR